MDKPTCTINIIDKSQTRVNQFGHTVYDFYPNRKFVGNVVIGYWKLEIAYIEEVVELFWLFDSLNIKVTVLGSKNQLPMWSLYSHEMISVMDANTVIDLPRKYSKGKDVYHQAGIVDLCPGLYANTETDKSKRFANRLWIAPGIQTYRDDIKRLTNGGWKDVYDIDEKDWFLFRSKKMHEYYHNRQPSIWVDRSAYDGYERLVDHFGFDDSPKIDIEFKWAKKIGGIDDRFKFKSEKLMSAVVHEATRKLLNDGFGDKLFNYDLQSIDSGKTKTNFPFTREILKLTDCAISTASILLSLNNGFSYASQAGASSYFYLMPTNILWAEHQYWYHHWKNNAYFKDRWLQRLYGNDSELFSTYRPRGADARPRRDSDTGVPEGRFHRNDLHHKSGIPVLVPSDKTYLAKKETIENEQYIADVYTVDYFYNLFYNYVYGK
jgi:hypothetical protein